MTRGWRAAIVVPVVLLGLAVPTSTRAQPAAASLLEPPAPPGRPAWRRLELKARAGLVRATMAVDVELRPAATAVRDLAVCPEDTALSPLGATLVILDVSTDATFSARLSTRTWLDESGRTLQVESRRPERWRLRRFAAGGFHEWSARPRGRSERAAGHEHWSIRAAQHRSWPILPGDPAPADGPTVLWLAAVLALEGDEGRRSARAASREGTLVELAVAGAEVVDVEHRLSVGALPGATVVGPRQARRVQVKAGGEEGSPRLLGLGRAIEILVDVETGLPLEIRGRAPGVGAVRARLTAAQLLAPP